MATATVYVDTSGPLFTGAAPYVVDRILDDAKTVVAAQALAHLRGYMDRYFKNPTPYYETQVLAEQRADTVAVHDRGIVYGPWLAGVGSRNATSRFKGYTHWRQAVQDTERDAPRLVERVVRSNLWRLG